MDNFGEITQTVDMPFIYLRRRAIIASVVLCCSLCGWDIKGILAGLRSLDSVGRRKKLLERLIFCAIKDGYFDRVIRNHFGP